MPGKNYHDTPIARREIGEQLFNMVKRFTAGEFVFPQIGYLLTLNPDVNVRDENGDTLLIYCCRTDLAFVTQINNEITSTYIAEILIDYQHLLVNLTNFQGKTALDYAVTHNNLTVISLLLSKNATGSNNLPILCMDNYYSHPRNDEENLHKKEMCLRTFKLLLAAPHLSHTYSELMPNLCLQSMLNNDEEAITALFATGKLNPFYLFPMQNNLLHTLMIAEGDARSLLPDFFRFLYRFNPEVFRTLASQKNEAGFLPAVYLIRPGMNIDLIIAYIECDMSLEDLTQGNDNIFHILTLHTFAAEEYTRIFAAVASRAPDLINKPNQSGHTAIEGFILSENPSLLRGLFLSLGAKLTLPFLPNYLFVPDTQLPHNEAVHLQTTPASTQRIWENSYIVNSFFLLHHFIETEQTAQANALWRFLLPQAPLHRSPMEESILLFEPIETSFFDFDNIDNLNRICAYLCDNCINQPDFYFCLLDLLHVDNYAAKDGYNDQRRQHMATLSGILFHLVHEFDPNVELPIRLSVVEDLINAGALLFYNTELELDSVNFTLAKILSLIDQQENGLTIRDMTDIFVTQWQMLHPLHPHNYLQALGEYELRVYQHLQLLNSYVLTEAGKRLLNRPGSDVTFTAAEFKLIETMIGLPSLTAISSMTFLSHWHQPTGLVGSLSQPEATQATVEAPRGHTLKRCASDPSITKTGLSVKRLCN